MHYTLTQRYEFYVRVKRTISCHSDIKFISSRHRVKYATRFIFKSKRFLSHLICLVTALSALSRRTNVALTRQKTTMKCFCNVYEIKRSFNNNPVYVHIFYNRTCFPEAPSSPSFPGSPISPFLKTNNYMLLLIIY